ncbi:hypothetical protein E2C01_047901 [Portunus trituberculatus]|uniref:Uncharacterized protein n=1 Tax=Portunus trituberculatus TaxID=210409 RepID=A0A5B7G944_PORTR|nr:hypothetical protein [Portunus trituberculatus]
MAEFLDTSNFPTNHPCYRGDRKGQLGLLKSETGCSLIKEAIILKPKMYSLLLEDGKQVSRGKGIPAHHQQKLIHQEYRDALNNTAGGKVTCYHIQNVKGQICATRSEKRTLSHFDDKRFYLDGVSSRANMEIMRQGTAADVEMEEEEEEEEEEEREEEETDLDILWRVMVAMEEEEEEERPNNKSRVATVAEVEEEAERAGVTAEEGMEEEEEEEEEGPMTVEGETGVSAVEEEEETGRKRKRGRGRRLV